MYYCSNCQDYEFHFPDNGHDVCMNCGQVVIVYGNAIHITD